MFDTHKPPRDAYKRLKYYDDVLTARKRWSEFYMEKVWKVDDNKIASDITVLIPKDFSGSLLDVPIGTSVFTWETYKNLPSARIVGLDYSQTMLEMARQRFMENNITHVDLIQGDVEDLPFENVTFDAVLSMNGLHTFQNKEKAFAEMFRVLKRGGWMCGCFYVKGERFPADFLVATILNRKGLFRAPHYTKEEAIALLKSYYGENLWFETRMSMLLFKGIKTRNVCL